jgi:Zn ribbon nucleic-acid-binding protein
MEKCPKCQEKKIIGIEYGYGHPERYDGVSEWLCAKCGYRQGRWTEKELKNGDVEQRYGGK